MEGKRAKPGADYNNFCVGRKPLWLYRKKAFNAYQPGERIFMVHTIYIIDNPALASLRFTHQHPAWPVFIF